MTQPSVGWDVFTEMSRLVVAVLQDNTALRARLEKQEKAHEDTFAGMMRHVDGGTSLMRRYQQAVLELRGYIESSHRQCGQSPVENCTYAPCVGAVALLKGFEDFNG